MSKEELLKVAKPILFNKEMVKAILEGQKTVTRRCVKAKSKNACGFFVVTRESDSAFMGVYDYDENEMMYESPQTQPAYVGDIMYVRETWTKDNYRYMYRANYSEIEKFYRDGKEVQLKWKPSIHMPKEAARIFLKVTDVRVEQLQDMDKMDALKEGIDNRLCINLSHALTKFKKLWNSTIKKSDIDLYGWDVNPWVWVIEFERIGVEE